MYSLNLVYVVILRVFAFVELLVNYTIRMGNFPGEFTLLKKKRKDDETKMRRDHDAADNGFYCIGTGFIERFPDTAAGGAASRVVALDGW